MTLRRMVRPFRQALRRATGKARRTTWSIGIYAGTSPVRLTAARHAWNPVLTASDVTDRPAAIVADPFMLRTDQTWHMFFEVLNAETERGEIGWATSRDGYSWRYRQIVLAEPFHLSYPYVFHHENAIYMIPESHQARSVRLYKARRFPTDWAFVYTLLEGPYLSDTSVIWRQGMWWMFTETGQTLRLFYADELRGPWRQHPRSPVVANNPHIARPAGRLVTWNNGLLRYAQDDNPIYGKQVWAFEIIEMTPRSYVERPVSPLPILEPAARGWNGQRMHHLDPHEMSDGSWLACVDGYGIEPHPVARLGTLARRRLAGLRDRAIIDCAIGRS